MPLKMIFLYCKTKQRFELFWFWMHFGFSIILTKGCLESFKPSQLKQVGHINAVHSSKCRIKCGMSCEASCESGLMKLSKRGKIFVSSSFLYGHIIKISTEPQDFGRDLYQSHVSNSCFLSSHSYNFSSNTRFDTSTSAELLRIYWLVS